MEVLFLKILNMSISAVWIVLAVVLMRLLLKKAPKAVCVALWAIVALRLVVPFSFESVFSLIPSAETIPESIVSEPFTGINSGFEVIDHQVNGFLAENTHTANGDDNVSVPVQNERNTIGILSAVWLCGVGAMAIYFAVSYASLYRKVGASVNIGSNVYICDDIATPFILGVLRPKIYIQSNLGDEQITHILAHENAHIKRLDHWWKPIGFAVLAVHWFNPAVWLAYILLCRDIEYACDEKVIKRMDGEAVRSYSETLLNCSVSSKRITACPVAFGEVSVKERIKTVLNYKRPAFWIIIAAVLVCAVTAAVFLTNPLADKSSENESGESGADLLGNRWFEAIVLEVSSESVLVKPCEGTNELRCSDKITFKVLNNDYSALKAGQKIRIFYDSVIQETYPARLPNVKKVEIVGDVMPNALVCDIKTAFTGFFSDKSLSLYTDAVNASLLEWGHSPIHVFTEYDKFESFLKQYRGHWYGETDTDSTLGLLESYDSDYFIDKAVVLVYTEETFQFANTVSYVDKYDSLIIIGFSPMYIDSPITGYRCKFHAIGIDKTELIGVDTFQAKAEKPKAPEENSQPVDNNVYDVKFEGFSTRAAFFIDFTSPLYKYSLNYSEVTDKTVYGCPVHSFKTLDEMKNLLEPYKAMDIGVMADGVERILDEGEKAFKKYDTVFVAYVKSYNFDVSFYPSTLKKQGNRLMFGTASNGPEVISDVQSGWFVLYGVNSSDIEGCSSYSATVTDREFYVVPKVETEAFKIDKVFELDDDMYGKSVNAPMEVFGSLYEMPVYLFNDSKALNEVFGKTERLAGEKKWTEAYDDGYFESKALVVCYFTAPSGSHTYGVSDRTGTILRPEFNGAFLYIVAERTDPPGEAETADMQGWIVVLETDKAHLDREMVIIDAYVEYENTQRH